MRATANISICSLFSRFQTKIRELTEYRDDLSLKLEAANETNVEQRNIIDQLTLQVAERGKTINEKEEQLVNTEKEYKNEVRFRWFYLFKVWLNGSTNPRIDYCHVKSCFICLDKQTTTTTFPYNIRSD